MSDDEGDSGPVTGAETRGQMVQRHKREMTDLKKGKAGRGLSKKDLAQKEKELKEKHDKELADFDKKEKEVPAVKADAEEETKDETKPASTTSVMSSAPVEAESAQSKASRAQKRKQAKQKATQDREAQIQEDIKNGGPDKRAIEQEAMVNKLLEEDRVIRPVLNSSPDTAANPQLQLLELNGRGSEYSTQSLRSSVADFILNHSDDYLPFVAEDRESFNSYCATMKSTSAWGGQVELQAISRLLKVKIHIYHSDSDTVVMGEEYPSSIALSYHKYEYALGEHYNSVGKLSGDS